jgi:hypothetical protein
MFLRIFGLYLSMISNIFAKIYENIHSALTDASKIKPLHTQTHMNGRSRNCL